VLFAKDKREQTTSADKFSKYMTRQSYRNLKKLVNNILGSGQGEGISLRRTLSDAPGY